MQKNRQRAIFTIAFFILQLVIAFPVGAVDIYVSSFVDGQIYKIDSETGARTVIASGIYGSEDIAIDTQGIMYIGGAFRGVKRIDIASGARLTDVGTNICGPEGPSIDKEGNVYFNTRMTPCNHSGIWKITGGTETIATQVVPPFSSWGEGTAFLTKGPYAGCIIASDSTTGRIVRSCPPDFGTAVNFIRPGGITIGIAINSTGDIFISRITREPSATSGDILRYDPNGIFKGVFATDLKYPLFMEFDEADNLYVVELDRNQVIKISPIGVKTVLAIGLNGPAGIAIPPQAKSSNFNSVRLIDTISTANIDLDTSSFSKQPVSITQDTANNKTMIEWQFSSFSIGQLEKLNFDVILKNPIPGEDRLVNHKLELIYQDAAGNQIRKELPSQYVHVLNSNFNIIPTTDKIEYNANEQGIVNLTITNIGDMARTVDIHVNMVDSIGNMVSQITLIPNTTFNAGQTLTFPNITFSTGNTFSGPYQIQATLYEQTNPAGRGKTDIAIKSPIPSLGISSGITTDKTAYNANENVKIASIVTSTAQNYIYTNLTAKIKITNPNNQIITEYTRNIQTLMPNARSEGSFYFNTASNPPGIYNVIQEIYQGTEKISQSAAAFTILSTAQTGIGIAGTITPNPKTIIRWQPITINYNVTNIGNSNISDLNLKILIIDPETGNALIILTDTISQLSIGSTTTNLKTIPNLDLIATKKPKDYLIILQGALPAGAVTMASSYITVMPPLNITKETKGNARALIWLCKENNGHHQSHETDNECKGETDPLEPIIKEALKQLGIYYYLIVYDKKDFEIYLRSNEFNTYLIFNDHEPIEDHIDEELTEHINAGKGIIAFFIKKEEEHNNNDNNENSLPVFGVRFKGYLPDEQRTLYLADTELTDADTITTSGKVEKTELLPNSSAQIMAYFNDGTPAIITNTYGNGKAILYTFDLRKTTETATQTQLTNLLKKAIKYTAPAKEPIISGGIIPVTIKIQSLGTAATLKIEEQLPPNATIITDSTAIRTGDVLSWVINIAANETKEIAYYLIAPDAANITLNTSVYYLSTSSIYELYDQVQININIKNSITQITAPIIEKLNSLILTDKKADEERQEIIKNLTELQNQIIPQDKKDANKAWEEAIKKTLKAIEELKDIREQLQNANLLDINTEKSLTEIRLGLDELLIFAEIKWYGSR